MRRILNCAMRLYPRAWRERYGQEFAALLEQLEPSWKIVFDTAQGALTMQLRKPGLVALTLTFALAGGLLASVVYWSHPAQYRSRAVLTAKLGSGPMTTQREAELLGPLVARVLSRRALAELVTELDLYPELRKQQPLEDVLEEMKRSIRIGPAPVGTATELSFDYPQPYRAQAVVGRLVNRLVVENLRLHSAGTLELVDPPTYPQHSLPGKFSQMMAQGLVGGALLGAAAGWWRARRAA